jgi:hypothetical protein
MRQACVQSEYISNIDKAFNNIGLFIFEPNQKGQALILSIIAAWCDHVTWWKFPGFGVMEDHRMIKTSLDHVT